MGLLDGLALTEVASELARNIVSLRVTQDLFDDLTDDADEQALATAVEMAAKPPEYQVAPPVVHRPFEETKWFQAIGFPFEHWSASRFSAGAYGVWYGAWTIPGTVYETAYHWRHGLLADAEGFLQTGVAIERKVYWVRCDAALVDLRPALAAYPALVHPSDYTLTQQVGARLHHEGHPGLVTRSARCADTLGAIFTPRVLSAPRTACFLTYTLTDQGVSVARERGREWFRIK
jgi:hypothetical protein